MTYSELDDPELILRAQQGDSAAFSELYKRYYATIFGIAHRKARSYATAEDLTSEAFLRALRKISQLTVIRPGCFPKWTATILYNLCRDHARKIVIEQTLPVGTMVSDRDFGKALTEIHFNRVAKDPTAEAAESADLYGRLQYYLQELSELQRVCIIHRFFDELSIKETADKMGVSEGAVKQLQHRATTRLRHLL